MAKKDRRVYAEHPEMFEKEERENVEAFGHKIPRNIEIEPFEHPPVSLQNARMLRNIKRKKDN